MSLSPGAKPKLPRGVRLTHNEAQGGWVLLAPERVFKADLARLAQIICNFHLTCGSGSPHADVEAIIATTMETTPRDEVPPARPAQAPPLPRTPRAGCGCPTRTRGSVGEPCG